MRSILFIISVLFASPNCFAQEFNSKDSSKILEEVVITSTRTATKLSNVAVPVKIISQTSIQQSGQLRLKDVLAEQAGLYITNGFGAGVQMQGLNPDYTLILLNGEPLVGRTAGVLDLNRISVSNIKKIEIVKGPSSSLYGSEAMAGVINIITDQTASKSIETGVRYGFGNSEKGWITPIGKDVFKNIDYNLNLKTIIGKTSLQLSSNIYYLDGISYRPHSTATIAQPIYRITNQLYLSRRINSKLNLNLSMRNGYDYIKQEFAVTNNGAISNSFGREANNDFNFNPTLTYRINKNTASFLKLYSTIYNGSQRLHFSNNPDSLYNDEFKQHFYRVENQTDFNHYKYRASIGSGYTIDQANSTRYDHIENNKTNQIFYVFAQHEWNPTKKLFIISGVRYDHNQLFAAAFSPKIAIRYNAGKSIGFSASMGRGFKAPDFRQLYLNFTNNAAGGYSVFGTIDAVKIINQMESIGEISEIKEDFYKLYSLKPESSTGLNFGINYSPNKKIKINSNFFRNDVKQLIDARQVATKSNGAQIFSYINIKNAFTMGGEIEINYLISKKISLNSSYQYLITADKDELAKINAQQIYTRNTDGTSRLLKKSEYTGLANRSKHLLNVKLNYESTSGFYFNARINLRSKWYVADSDGNGVYNTSDEHANHSILVNVSGGYLINKKWLIYGGIDNLFNYRDIFYLPNLQGRMIYTGINFKIK